MSEFTPINTQEEFDERIKERLKREREKFSDYEDIKTQLADANSKIAGYEKTIEANKEAFDKLSEELNEKNTKIAGYETEALRTTVAINKKLPMNMRKYLQGSTEEELNASADELIKSGVGGISVEVPLGNQKGSSAEGDYSTTGKVNTERAMKKFEESLKSMNE